MRLKTPISLLAVLAALAGCGKSGTSAPAPKAVPQVVSAAPGFNGAYAVGRPQDPVAALRTAFDLGLRFGGDAPDFLRQVLAAAGIDERSQVLVFSKTSHQNDAIGFSTPRALYFSDDCYMGMVQRGMFEVAEADAKAGTVFFALDFLSQPAQAPHWDSPPRCMDCHDGAMTHDRPGLMVRSVFVDQDNQPISSAGTFLVDHETPLADRWGGWFVTGRHGAARHMGNAIAIRRENGSALQDRGAGANLDGLAGLVDTSPYLRDTSDIVALMVLEHQIMLHNAYTQGSLNVREQVTRHRAVMRELGQPGTELSPELQRLIRNQARRIVGMMLFKDEAAMPAGGVEGNADFQAAFRLNRREAAAGPAAGRSLKDFQLLTRLFKYRCSYTVYSRAFDQMDGLLKAEVWRQLRQALLAEDELSSHLPAGEKAQIWEILRQTKTDMPAQ